MQLCAIFSMYRWKTWCSSITCESHDVTPWIALPLLDQHHFVESVKCIAKCLSHYQFCSQQPFTRSNFCWILESQKSECPKSHIRSFLLPGNKFNEGSKQLLLKYHSMFRKFLKNSPSVKTCWPLKGFSWPTTGCRSFWPFLYRSLSWSPKRLRP